MPPKRWAPVSATELGRSGSYACPVSQQHDQQSTIASVKSSPAVPDGASSLTLSVRALVLDMDDTINQTTPAMRTALRTAATELWPDVAQDLMNAAVERYAFDGAGWFQRFSSGQIDFTTMRRGRLADMASQLGDTLAEGKFEQFEARYRGTFIASCKPFPDALRLIGRAQSQNIPVAVLSNSAHHMTLCKIEQLGMQDVFSAVLCADQLGAGKPAISAYRAACEAMHSAPELVGYVDDMARDARGGAQAGLMSVWLDRPRGAADADREHSDLEGAESMPRITSLDTLALERV